MKGKGGLPAVLAVNFALDIAQLSAFSIFNSF
jgi:hypothetical protein